VRLVRRAARLAAATLRERQSRWWVLVVAGVYVVVYLLAIGNLAISPGGAAARFVEVPSVQVVDGWPTRMFERIAPFAFEPVAAVYPVRQVALLVAPLNIAMGLGLGLLVGVNVVASVRLGRGARACGRRAFPGVLGALPGFLTGFACCVPTFALLLGAQVTVAVVALRNVFFPFAVLALLAALLWVARRDAAVSDPQPLDGRVRDAAGVPTTARS
jgi:hypothetical protein